MVTAVCEMWSHEVASEESAGTHEGAVALGSAACEGLECGNPASRTVKHCFLLEGNRSPSLRGYMVAMVAGYLSGKMCWSSEEQSSGIHANKHYGVLHCESSRESMTGIGLFRSSAAKTTWVLHRVSHWRLQ